jgi:hypothetical protein
MADDSYWLAFVRTSRIGCRPITGPLSPQDKFRRNAYIYLCMRKFENTSLRGHEGSSPCLAQDPVTPNTLLLICFRDRFYFPNALLSSHSCFIVYCSQYSSRRVWKVRSMSLFLYSVFVLLIKVSVYTYFSNFLHFCFKEIPVPCK